MIPTTIDTALDIETSAAYGHPNEYALQPWRVLEGRARTTMIALGKAQGQSKLAREDFGAVLESRIGKPTSGWNLLFDVAFLIAEGHYHIVNRIPWVDGMLLWKWAENGVIKEMNPGWSLTKGAERWLKDWPLLEQFLDLKQSEHTAGVDDQYWALRGKMDAVVTAMITERIWAELSEAKRRSAMIEMRCVVPVARSWVMGVPMNPERIEEAAPTITAEMRQIEQQLGVSNKVLSSPKQMQKLLYEDWGLQPIQGMVSEKTGDPKTDKAALTYLAERDQRVLNILRWRHLNTQYTKFIQSPRKAFDYLGKTTVHPAPALFSTLTGRMTYASKVKQKFQTGVALHQWQRDKVIRSLICPPSGYELVEFDASGQEDRFMATFSQDPMLCKIFRDDMDVHTYTASNITDRPYDELMQMKVAKDPWLTGANGMRQAGKVTNHSNKYRIGPGKMRITAKVDYGMDIDEKTAAKWQAGFHRGFPGVKRYWQNAIYKGKSFGCATTLAGRTYKLPQHMFTAKDRKWMVESNAINFPIQGSGADMKELAIATLHEQFPDLLFAFDLHDGLFFYVPKGTPMTRLYEARDTLDNMDYEAAWGWKPPVPMIWDGEFGPDWGHMTELGKEEQTVL